jgi:pimeloyl-ACP methyl ester carboxylesterase
VTSDLIVRTDWFVTSEPGVEIFVREAIEPGRDHGVPVLLVHGGGGGGVASFDLPVPACSLMTDLAAAGHPVYTLDIRGWGSSTTPPEFAAPPEANPPAVQSAVVMRDLAAVAEAIRERRQVDQLALVGWATGGHWAAMYASQHPDKVSHLVSLNSLYSLDAPWAFRSAFEDKAHPGVFEVAPGAYAYRTAESLTGAWRRSFLTDDPATWIDPRVMPAYVDAILASDPTSGDRNPPSVRSPRGFQFDSYLMSRGHQFWDASDIRAATLIIRGGRDFWSRPEDLIALGRDLTNAARVRQVTIPDGTHFLFNDLPERGRQQFLAEVTAWLRSE